MLAMKESLSDILMSMRWYNKSSQAIADHFRIEVKDINDARNRLGLAPEVYDMGNGKTKKNWRLPKNAKPLSERQHRLIEEMLPYAETYARRKANSILDENDLLSIAQDALVVAAYYWKPERQNGKEQSPGSKWRGFAGNGIKRAFAREFKQARKKLQKTALIGANHPYQQSYLEDQLRLKLSIFSTEEDGHTTGAAESIPDRPEPRTMFSRLQKLTVRERRVLTQVAGLDGKRPWSAQDVAEFWGTDEATAQSWIEHAKASMVELGAEPETQPQPQSAAGRQVPSRLREGRSA